MENKTSYMTLGTSFTNFIGIEMLILIFQTSQENMGKMYSSYAPSIGQLSTKTNTSYLEAI